MRMKWRDFEQYFGKLSIQARCSSLVEVVSTLVQRVSREHQFCLHSNRQMTQFPPLREASHRRNVDGSAFFLKPLSETSFLLYIC